MGHSLLINDNNVLSDIYCANLQAYIDMTVTIKRTTDEALKFLDFSPSIDMIIHVASSDPDKSAIEARQVHEYVEQKVLDIPVIFIGQKNKFTGKAIFIDNKLDIKPLIRSSAKLLGITAKAMADKSVPDYYPIPFGVFENLEFATCDVFIRQRGDDGESEYIKLWEKDHVIMGKAKQLKEEEKNTKFLYVPSPSRLAFINTASKSIISVLKNPKASKTEKLAASEQGMNMLSKQLALSPEATEAISEISEACMDAMKDVIGETKEPKVTNLLKLLSANKSHYCYAHGIIANYIANTIVEKIDWGGKEHKEKISYVLFFHDIFLVPLFLKYPQHLGEQQLLIAGELSQEEKDLVLNHAQMASELISNFKNAPMGADTICAQHHGASRGVGIEFNPRDDISPLAKVIMVSEGFADTVFEYFTEGRMNEFDVDKAIATLKLKFKRLSYHRIIDQVKDIAF